MEYYTPRRSQPWIEKYPPRLKEIKKLQDEALQELKRILSETRDHIFVHGFKGIGKSSVTLSVVLSPELHKYGVLWLTATESSGVSTELISRGHLPRNAVSILSESESESEEPVSTNVVHPKRRRLNSFGSPELSVSTVLKPSANEDRVTIHDVLSKTSGSVQHQGLIIIIDEVHLLTDDDQTELIRVMESCSSDVRFIFEYDYNHIYSDMESLASKCQRLSFKPLPDKYVSHSISDICKKENLDLHPKALRDICDLARGSLFQAITCLQFSARSYRADIRCKDLIPDGLEFFKEKVEEFLQICKQGVLEWTMSATLVLLYSDFSDLPLYLSQIYDLVAQAEDISCDKKEKICRLIVEADKTLLENGNVSKDIVFQLSGNLIQVLADIPEDDLSEFWENWEDDWQPVNY